MLLLLLLIIPQACRSKQLWDRTGVCVDVTLGKRDYLEEIKQAMLRKHSSFLGRKQDFAFQLGVKVKVKVVYASNTKFGVFGLFGE